MTNRGTAKRMNNTDDTGTKERIPDTRRRHMEEHPNDVISFLQGDERESMKDLLGMDDRNVHWITGKYRSISPKRIEQILTYLENNDTKKLYACSGHHLRSIAMDWLDLFRRKSDVKSPDMPLDSTGEVIPYPKGGGRGKIAVVEWLCKYEERYRTLKKEEDMSHDIEQSIL